MGNVWLTIEETGTRFCVPVGVSLKQALEKAGLAIDAPCGGNGLCGKCRVLVNGRPQLACRTILTQDALISLPPQRETRILNVGRTLPLCTDGRSGALAFDLGTTTIAACLLGGQTGRVLARAGLLNPQTAYGADVISRLQFAQEHGAVPLCDAAWDALRALTAEVTRLAGFPAECIDTVCLVGNPAMHHLLLGYPIAPLLTPPYMPAQRHAVIRTGIARLPVHPDAELRVLPNIAGFVGADTVACLLAADLDACHAPTLLLDIGTNGEMVLCCGARRVACSTAAGPAFEGARISCGMRGTAGAIDRVWLEQGKLRFHTIGETPPVGLCGSGLLDLAAALLDAGILEQSGRLTCGDAFPIPGTSFSLTQKDVRELQLAKAAIRAGVTLLCAHMGIAPDQIERVELAGAFGNYLDPVSACRIGLLPPMLLSRIHAIGNAAAVGAARCALSRAEFARSTRLAEETEFLELASRPDFQDCYVDALQFGEEDAKWP